MIDRFVGRDIIWTVATFAERLELPDVQQLEVVES